MGKSLSSSSITVNSAGGGKSAKQRKFTAAAFTFQLPKLLSLPVKKNLLSK